MVYEVVTYLRVSTSAQEKSGLGLEAQRDYVQAAARQQGWMTVAEYIETVSGTIAPLIVLSVRLHLLWACRCWLRR
ncbi:recombinase family protein [Pseudomonas massiliensis]|uniref:recombinase family protein n=1 Tax=Pseudomonas massiliensis TaxID=522492 RepID=UPI0006932971|nr:recombinase family protein [Pseudomonas massiliensis]